MFDQGRPLKKATAQQLNRVQLAQSTRQVGMKKRPNERSDAEMASPVLLKRGCPPLQLRTCTRIGPLSAAPSPLSDAKPSDSSEPRRTCGGGGGCTQSRLMLKLDMISVMRSCMVQCAVQ